MKKVLIDVDQTLILPTGTGADKYNDNLIRALFDTGNTSVVLFTSMSLNNAASIKDRLLLIKHLKNKGIDVEDLIMTNDPLYNPENNDSKKSSLFRTAITLNSFEEIYNLEQKVKDSKEIKSHVVRRTAENISKSKNSMLDLVIQRYPNHQLLLIDDTMPVIRGCEQRAKEEDIGFDYILNRKVYTQQNGTKTTSYKLDYNYYVNQLVKKGYVVDSHNRLAQDLTTKFNNTINKNWLDNLRNISDPMIRNPIIITTLFVSLGIFLAFYNSPTFALFAANKVLTIAAAAFFGMLLAQISYKISYNKRLNANYSHFKISKNFKHNIFITPLYYLILFFKNSRSLGDANEIIVYYLSTPLIITAAVVIVGVFTKISTMLLISLAIATFLININIYYNFHDAKKWKPTNKMNKFIPSIILACLFYLIVSANFLTSPLIAYLFANNYFLLFGMLFVGSFISISTIEHLIMISNGTYKDSALTTIIKFVLFAATLILITWAALAYFPQFAIIEVIKDLFIPCVMLLYIALSTTNKQTLLIQTYELNNKDIDLLTSDVQLLNLEPLEKLAPLATMTDTKEALKTTLCRSQ